MNERKWIDIEPAESSLSAYEVSKKVVNLLRHCQTIQREDDGAVRFWRIKFYLRNQFPQNQYWSDDRWKACLAARGGSKRRYQYCSDISGTIVYLRALQGHSGRSLIDPSLQDNVIIQCGLFQHVYHIGCAFNLHSIINNGLIPGDQDSSKRQTVFFLPVDPRDKEHQDPAHIDFNKQRRAQYLHSEWKKHQDAVFWVDIDLAIRKGLTFYQTRSNTIILQGTLPAYCIPKVVRLKTGEVLYEKSYMSPRPPPKISLRHDHDWTRGNDQWGSTVEQQQVGKIVRRSRGEVQRATFSQLTQPKPKPICDRSGKPVNLSENTRVEQTHDGSGQPDERNRSTIRTVKEQFVPEENRDIASFNADNEFNHAINEEDIDFNIPGLPHSAVKQSHGTNVQGLIPKIENHAHRQALHSDLQQRQQFNPFSKESKDMIREGNRKHSAKYACRIGTSALSTARAGTSCEMERRRTRTSSSTLLDLLSIPNYYIKKGRPHGHRYGKKPGDHEYFTANSLKKKCKKRHFLGIHDRFIRHEKFRREHD